ncbi:MAG: hypothetical protein WBD31_30945 [Rubripirellula sp.]
MNKMWIPICFALLTAFFWGCYGPLIGNANAPMVDGAKLWSPYKPYLFVGVAYLIIAIIGGAIMMSVKGDSFNFSGVHYPTMKWGFLAGSFGAIGALFLTSAMMTSKGNAALVMPIVFGGAVSVSAIIGLLRLHGGVTISPLLWVGLVTTVVGVTLTAMNTPHGHAPAKPTAETPVVSAADESPAATDEHV